MNGGVTQWKLCRVGACVDNKPYVIREVASVNDDTVM